LVKRRRRRRRRRRMRRRKDEYLALEREYLGRTLPNPVR